MSQGKGLSMNKKINNVKQLFHLTKRHFLVFMKDKLTLFFSLLGPLIVVLVFLLFLKNIQVDAALGVLQQNGITGSSLKAKVTSLVLNDMFGGVMATSIITVSFAACGKIVEDKVNGISNLYLASPIRKSVLIASYILATFVTSFVINLVVYFVSLIVLGATNSFYMTAADVFMNIGLILVGVLSASTIFIVIVEGLNKTSQVAGLGTIIGAVSGFFLGAYVPLSQLGTFIKKAVLLLPGTYATNVLKEGYLTKAVEEIAKGIGDDKGIVKELFDWRLEYFKDRVFVPKYGSFIVLIASSIVFFTIYILIKKFAGKTKKKTSKKTAKNN